MIYQINGVEQKRPGDWLQAQKNSSFRKTLIEFLAKVWSDDSSSEILRDKVLFLNNDDTCWRYKSANGCVLTKVINNFSCHHEEADTRMFYHSSNIQGGNNVVLRTNDTDCLIIGLSTMDKLAEDVNVWIEAGVQSTNSQWFISLIQFYITLGKTFCQSLPSYHAFTGYDYTASFSRRGKVNALKILGKNMKFEQLFYDIGLLPTNTAPMIVLLNEWSCSMYGRKKFTNVDDARLEIFLQKYKNNTITSVKKLDGYILPPCSRVLLQKIKKTQLITRCLLSATEQTPPPERPENNCWELDDNGYKILWFESTATPNIVVVMDSAEDEGWLKVPLNCLYHFLFFSSQFCFMYLVINSLNSIASLTYRSLFTTKFCGKFRLLYHFKKLK